ncbi:MAG: hypothetical protein PHD37_00315 [Gallionellaceae bacterium]|nr:hypothetical protein [Gallionellaceae bacterium]
MRMPRPIVFHGKIMRAAFTKVLINELSFENVPVRIGVGNVVISEHNTSSKPYVVYDNHRNAPVGFGVKVTKNSKVYFVQRRIGSRVVKIKVGHVNDYDHPDDARFAARRLIQEAIDECLDTNSKVAGVDVEGDELLVNNDVKSNLLNSARAEFSSKYKSIDDELTKAKIRSELDGLSDGTVLSVEMAAIYLGIGEKTFARMRQRKEGPPYFRYETDKMASNRRVLYRLGELRKYLVEMQLVK